MKYAYIFDFDGVLADSMEAHFACYKQALEEVNVPVDREQFYRQAGMTGIEQITYFADKAGVDVSAQDVYARKREIWNNSEHNATPIRCNIDLMKLLQQAGHPVAIASGSSRPSILPIMKALGIFADVLVTSEDVARGKPFPDLFLKAAEKLNVPAEYCVVVEDSEVGIESALAGGMKALRFFDWTDGNLTE